MLEMTVANTLFLHVCLTLLAMPHLPTTIPGHLGAFL